jgi:hypothetical protein
MVRVAIPRWIFEFGWEEKTKSKIKSSAGLPKSNQRSTSRYHLLHLISLFEYKRIAFIPRARKPAVKQTMSCILAILPLLATPSLSMVTLIHSLKKLRPTDPIPPDAIITSLTSAKNEYESFQISIDDPRIVNNVIVTFPSPIATLVHEVRYINITTVSNCEGDIGRWPDPLVPVVDPR